MSDVTITDSNFQKEVLESKTPVIVDFWAPWCGPCRAVSPVIEELAKELQGKVVVGKLNVDENPEVAGQFNVMSIPTVIVFKDGQPLKAIVGAQSKDTYKQAISAAM